MKYKSALVTDLSGSIEGMTASRNRGGQYLRARTIPVNPNTPAQELARQSFGTQASAWMLLSPEEQQAWIDAGAMVIGTDPLGQSYSLSGQQLYQKQTVAFVHANAKFALDPAIAIQDLPPANLTENPLGTSPLPDTADAGAQTVGIFEFDNTAPWANNDEGLLMVFQHAPVGPGVKPGDGPWRAVGVVRGDNGTPPTAPVSFPSAYNLQDGQLTRFQYQALSPGWLPGQKDMSGIGVVVTI